MRVLITGSGGRLGAALARQWAGRHAIIALGRADCDYANPDAAEAAVEAHRFDALVGCAALTQVDHCETHREEADRVNGETPGRLAALCARRGVRMIQIGTDYVFDGTKTDPYTEDDPANPVSVYGASKLLGDHRVLDASGDHLAVRVSWVFGPDRPSFLDQILRRAHQQEQAAAIADKWSSPAFTLDLAEWLEPLLDRAASPGGILHLCNAGATTWREYGQFAIDLARREGSPVLAREVAPLALESMTAFVAKRPVHSALDTSRFTAWTGIRTRPWQEAVEAYLVRHGGLAAARAAA